MSAPQQSGDARPKFINYAGWDGELTKFTYGPESGMRDLIASAAWAAGWDVATEVTVPSGGRADIVLTAPTSPTVCMELKLKLTTLRAIRLGFQQADGYRRFFAAEAERGVLAILYAPTCDWDLAGPIADAYEKTKLTKTDSLFATVLGMPVGLEDRLAVAKRRRRMADHEAVVLRSAVEEVAGKLRSRHLARLARQYPAMAADLHAHLAAA